MNEGKERKEGEVGTHRHRYFYHYYKMCFKERKGDLIREKKKE